MCIAHCYWGMDNVQGTGVNEVNLKTETERMNPGMWLPPISPASRRLRQENCRKFEARLSYRL